MLGGVSTEPGQSGDAAKFRRNTHLALNNSRIFLEPSVVNVQTLATLAIHGEDFASPNLSWMLVGHACRQAEALSLHTPTGAESDSRQQRLCLFWLLFVIDKGCALAFGRQPFLPTSTYRNVPMPDYSYLAKYSPHINEVFDRTGQPQASQFGARFYITAFEMARLAGLILEAIVFRDSTLERENLRLQLDEWYRSTSEVCTFQC